MTAPSESALYLYFYETILDQAKTDQELNFIYQHHRFKSDDCLLDVPCFFGRHSLTLAKNHPTIKKIIAGDLNFNYLQRAKKEAIKNKFKNLEFVQFDMRRFCFQNVFSVALCLYTSFGYFSDQENSQVLQGYRQSLKTGGILFIDVINPNQFQEGTFEFIKKGQDNITDCIKKSKDEGFWKINRTYFVEGEKYSYDYQLRLYQHKEIFALLKKVGFKKISIFGDFDGSDYKSNSPRILLIAS